MKVKELFEEQIFRFELNYIFEFTSKIRFDAKKNEKEIRAIIESACDFSYSYIGSDFNYSYIGIDSMANKIMIRIGQVSSSQISNEKIENLKQVYAKALSDNLNITVNNISSGIELNTHELPSRVLKANRIEIRILSNFNLKGIEKLLIADENITISNLYLITGNVLSLLKLKSKKLFLLWCKSSSDTLWLDIIRKHLEDRDILACQDELIENGLKEYAKL